jgi:hypothetical protein
VKKTYDYIHKYRGYWSDGGKCRIRIYHLHGAPEGEGPKGKRAYGKVPRNRGKNTTLIAAITLEGAMGESMTVEGATDALAFEAYVEHFLAPLSVRGAGGGARWARCAQDGEGRGAHRGEGGGSRVLAFLLARLEPHRGGFQQDQAPRA